MPPSPPTRRRAGRTHRTHDPAPTRRFGGTRAGGLEAAFEAARTSHDAPTRLRAGALDALLTIVPAAVALAFRVDEQGIRSAELARAASLRRRTLDRIVPQLARLEAMDPFAVRHAHAAGARVRSVADVGGAAALGRTRYGRQLARHRLRAPLVAYFWRDGRIVAGVALLRTSDAPEFGAGDARVLGEIQPLLEDGFVGPASPRSDAPSRRGWGLTQAEHEVDVLAETGASVAAIAFALGMSEATVETCLARRFEQAGGADPTLLPWSVAAANPDPTLRTRAHALSAVVAAVPAALAVLASVDRRSDPVAGVALQCDDLDFSVAEAWRRYARQTVEHDVRGRRPHLASMGIVDHASVHVRVSGHVVASILLVRTRGSLPFSARDAAALRQLQPVLEHAFAGGEEPGPARV